MIEFIFPLNLPVRAVEVTEKAGSPSASLLQEMSRWAANYQGSSPTGQGFPTSNSADSRYESPDAERQPAEIEQELESLRSQRTLFTQATQELRRVSGLVERQLDGMIHEFEEATVELAQAIAAKLIFEEIDNNRFPVANLVHEVVSRLDESSNAVVRLHPDDLAIIQEFPAIGSSDDGRSIRFVGDSSLARGDCKAKAGEISVIYELRRQIDEIRRQLLSTVSGHAEI